MGMPLTPFGDDGALFGGPVESAAEERENEQAAREAAIAEAKVRENLGGGAFAATVTITAGRDRDGKIVFECCIGEDAREFPSYLGAIAWIAREGRELIKALMPILNPKDQ